MKKIVVLLCAALLVCVLTSCGSTPNAAGAAPEPENTDQSPSTDQTSAYTVKTGAYYSDQWGLYIANIVEQEGQAPIVIMDRVQNGQSSKERYDSYGIKPVSSIGKEWWEQIAFLEGWIAENGIEALEVDDTGHALNADVITSATINVAEPTSAVHNAMEGKNSDGGYTLKTGTYYDEQWGLYIANVIEEGGATAAVLLDRVQNGESHKEKYDTYGIKRVSTIDKDWWEQVAYYEKWVLENGVDAVEYDEDGHATNPDLITGATVGVDQFTMAVLDALK